MNYSLLNLIPNPSGRCEISGCIVKGKVKTKTGTRTTAPAWPLARVVFHTHVGNTKFVNIASEIDLLSFLFSAKNETSIISSNKYYLVMEKTKQTRKMVKKIFQLWNNPVNNVIFGTLLEKQMHEKIFYLIIKLITNNKVKMSHFNWSRLWYKVATKVLKMKLVRVVKKNGNKK